MSTHKSTELPVIHKSDDIFTTFNHIQDMIREQADRIFHDRNPDEGDVLSDWLKAESEVLSDIDLRLENDKKQVVIKCDLEGFLPEEIEIKVGDGIVEIGGIHKEKSSRKKKGVTSATSKQINFYRSFRLPDSVDTDKMDVKLKSGKFTARIPKTSH